jgi:hypothetical protein
MWTPKEVRKLIILIAGILFVFFGIYLMVNQVVTTGSIDISSSLITGKIQSGSAGLFIAFIGLIMSLSSLISKESSVFPTLKNNKIFLALLLLILLFISLYIYIVYPKSPGIGLIITAFILLLAFICIAIVVEEADEQNSRLK